MTCYYIFGGQVHGFRNIISFYVLSQLLNLSIMPANIMAWVFAFVFSFVTNKVWVFARKEWSRSKVVKETFDFFIARIGTLLLDMAGMWFLVQILVMKEMWAKLAVNLVVIIVNYVASKFWVFK